MTAPIREFAITAARFLDDTRVVDAVRALGAVAQMPDHAAYLSQVSAPTAHATETA